MSLLPERSAPIQPKAIIQHPFSLRLSAKSLAQSCFQHLDTHEAQPEKSQLLNADNDVRTGKTQMQCPECQGLTIKDEPLPHQEDGDIFS